MILCVNLPNFVHIGPPKNMTSYRFFKMAAAAAQYYLRFPVCCCLCHQKVKIYSQTKFCRNSWNHGWIRFRFRKTNVRHIGIRLPVRPRPFHHSRVILHPAAEFRPNRTTILRKYDVISIFKMAAISHVVFSFGVMADHPRSAIYLSIYLSKKSRLWRRKCRNTTMAPNNVN